MDEIRTLLRDMTRYRHRPLVRLLVGISALGVIGSVAMGCGSEQGYHGFNFRNQTSVRVRVVQVLANGTEIGLVSAIDPGKSISVAGYPGLTPTGDPCTVLTLLARDEQMAEVARFASRICMDQEWVIRDPLRPGSPTPLGTRAR